MKFFFDIETLPAGPEQEPALRELYEKYKTTHLGPRMKNFDEFVLSTSFDGAFGRILCIGYAIDDKPAEIIHNEDEREVLKEFWKVVDRADLIVGHNVFDFDIPFVSQRTIVKQVKPSRQISLRRYTSDEVFDTYHEWTCWSRTHSKGSLDRLAKAFGLPSSKQGIDGSQVYDYFRAGKVGEILEYCKRDVELTRQIYKRMKFE